MSIVNSDQSFMLITSPGISGISSYLYSKDYQIVEMDRISNGKCDRSIMSISPYYVDSIEEDMSHLFSLFEIKSIIAKSSNHSKPISVSFDGSRKFLEIVMYGNDLNGDFYIKDGISFSFIESKEYLYPKTKEEFKPGMIVECYTKNGWSEKIVVDVNEEYKSIYSTLSRYDRVRICL